MVTKINDNSNESVLKIKINVPNRLKKIVCAKSFGTLSFVLNEHQNR